MAEAKQSSRSTKRKERQGITKISVCGYKSIKDECTIDIYPLTILAGANSSGKSSIIQPLLLMKQTLEAPYDPGALLLNGPNVRFTSVDQLLTKLPTKKDCRDSFFVEIEADNTHSTRTTFKKDKKKAIDIIEMRTQNEDGVSILSPSMTTEEINSTISHNLQRIFEHLISTNTDVIKAIIRNRCFLEIGLKINQNEEIKDNFFRSSKSDLISNYIRKIIHVPGLRGNPERTYQINAIGDEFPGTFENYVASLIASWQDTRNPKLLKLGQSLKALGLAERVDIRKVDDTQVEVRVGHRQKNRTEMVSIADVGFGVSQTLPVLVALIVASPQQLVYIEQPEIHLHPRAQAALADIIVEAVNRGVRVTLETHSELFLRRIQSLVAEDKLAHDKVKLHWFSKDENGFTQISTADLDTDGSFGDWPEDFGDVDLQEESRYLDAADRKLAQKSHG
ncbi:MAG: AAA family ATPase [Chamaesiphon sp.]|nr:AAA family ATPase [Chamaesiphon sp.]